MPGNPLTDPNWAPDLTEQITTVIGTVRDKTTNNAVKAARAVVFGLLGLFLGSVALVLAFIAASRGLQSLYNIFTTWERAVYLSYFTLGGILTLVGLLLMSKRHSDA
jgi:protein-S-isoprenylcysteine O-methyltransferase Ste14